MMLSTAVERLAAALSLDWLIITQYSSFTLSKHTLHERAESYHVQGEHQSLSTSET